MWWQEGVIYQIYPRSFYDSNSDGIGDLAGITEKLEYLKWLGIDAFWISPFYPSPMKDFGYDISDYQNIDPVFGNLTDFDLLVQTAHKLNLKVIIDYVPNHSSDLHPWFIESRSSINNSKRDWYVWKDPKLDGSPPNNWQSRFGGGSAWTFDEHTGQYYLHSFLKEQPDLNWRNEEVKTAMLNVMRFWLDRGVDGFRVDAAYYCMKDPAFRDNPANPDWEEGMDPLMSTIETYSKNYIDIHDFNRSLRAVTDEYSNKVLIGELYLPFEKLAHHYGDSNEYHMPFNFSLIHSEWKASSISSLITDYEKHLPTGAWPNWVLGNHDQSRVASRVGKKQVKNSLLLLLTLRGTPTIYYGEELGLPDGKILNAYAMDPQYTLSNGRGFNRDCCRTPMLWENSQFAGFSSTVPWLPVHPDYLTASVENQSEDPDSVLNFTRRLLELRKKHHTLRIGSVSPIFSDHGILMYVRQSGIEKLLIVINFSSHVRIVKFKEPIKILETVFEDSNKQINVSERQLKCPGNHSAILQIANNKEAL